MHNTTHAGAIHIRGPESMDAVGLQAWNVTIALENRKKLIEGVLLVAPSNHDLVPQGQRGDGTTTVVVNSKVTANQAGLNPAVGIQMLAEAWGDFIVAASGIASDPRPLVIPDLIAWARNFSNQSDWGAITSSITTISVEKP